jgi:hypothetical protein
MRFQRPLRPFLYVLAYGRLRSIYTRIIPYQLMSDRLRLSACFYTIIKSVNV